MKEMSAASAPSSAQVGSAVANRASNSPAVIPGLFARLLRAARSPLQELKEEISNIAEDLAVHGGVIFNPRVASQSARTDAGDVFRQHSVHLYQLHRRLPRWLSQLAKLPSHDELGTAAENLVGLSNSVRALDRQDYNEKRVRAIEKALHLPRTM